MIQLQDIAPAEIEAESFRIIEAEFTEQTGRNISDYSEGEFRVLQRVIHATGDFSIADSMVFQHNPIEAAITAFRRGGDVVTDVNMVASGISRNILAKFGGAVKCRVADGETVELAREKGITRADAAMRLSCGGNLAAIAVGNAPTALVAALRLIDEEKIAPGLIVGVPVGFVNASESKEMLKQYRIPAITISGRRGGSPIAAAIINALLRLADK
jgi:precorrin-8X/cobalt-precorrin-8 methylmutase